MKILVCGGRSYDNADLVFKFLDELHAKTPVTCVVHGDAPGADALGKKWAETSSIEHKSYPADWKAHGRGAGPIRNKLMLDDNPDIALLVAFPGNNGTENMCRQAHERFIGIQVVKDPAWVPPHLRPKPEKPKKPLKRSKYID